MIMSMDVASHWSSRAPEVMPTPSGLDGIEPNLEAAYRFRTAWFVEELGITLSW